MPTEAYITNLFQFNSSMELLKTSTANTLDLTVKMIAFELQKRLKDASPVISGKLRGAWSDPKRLGFAKYEVANSAEYVWYVEIGPHGQPSLGFIRRTLGYFEPEFKDIFYKTFHHVIADLNRRRSI